MKIRLSGLVLALMMCVPLMGCSFSKQFAKTAGPVTDQIVLDEGRYLVNETDAVKKTAVTNRAQSFSTAVHAGDQSTAAPLWFGVPGVKDDYVMYLLADPNLQTPTGLIARKLLIRNTQTLDYVMGIGTTPASK